MARWKNALRTSDDIQRLKRDAVVSEAGRVFGRKGYHNTSLDDVAKSLGVAKGTLYNYVRDKQEILFECHRQALDIGDRAFDVVSREGATGGERLRDILLFYVSHLLDELGACAVLTEVDAMRPEDRVLAVARRDDFQKKFVAVLKAGMADGSIRKVDPKIAVFTFMGAINWVPRWYSPDGGSSAVAIATQMVDLLMSGLLVGEALTHVKTG